MTLTIMTSKGQITIPKRIRKYLGIHAGDQINFCKAGCEKQKPGQLP